MSPAPSEGLKGFTFINLTYITMRFDTVEAIMGEGFEINIFEDVAHFF